MKTEFLHEVVRKRERERMPSAITQAYNDMMARMEESYRRMYSADARAREAVDRYMSNPSHTPVVGACMAIPMLDINQPAGTLSSTHATYRFSGDTLLGYRGWVRIS